MKLLFCFSCFQIVDTSATNCDNAFAYIPDLGSYAVVVYSLKDNKSWRVKHHYFHFDPLSGNYNVAGINFQWVSFDMATNLKTIIGKIVKNTVVDLVL